MELFFVFVFSIFVVMTLIFLQLIQLFDRQDSLAGRVRPAGQARQTGHAEQTQGRNDMQMVRTDRTDKTNRAD